MPTCIEIKKTLSGTTKTYECELVHFNKHYGILEYKVLNEWNIAGNFIPKDSTTYAVYWPARKYNLYWFVGPNKETLFYYFNIGDSFDLSPSTFAWRDLTIDLLITPKGSIRVLDEEELPDDLPEGIKTMIQMTVKYLFEDYRSVIEEGQELVAKHKILA